MMLIVDEILFFIFQPKIAYSSLKFPRHIEISCFCIPIRIFSYCTQEQQTVAFGRLNAMGNVGYIFGPALSGLILAQFGFETLFVVSTFFFATNAVVAYFYLPSDANLVTNDTTNDVKVKKSESQEKNFCWTNSFK